MLYVKRGYHKGGAQGRWTLYHLPAPIVFSRPHLAHCCFLSTNDRCTMIQKDKSSPV